MAGTARTVSEWAGTRPHPPRLINAACGAGDLKPLRRRACAGLRGEVVEIGSGPGTTCRSTRPRSPGSPRSSRPTSWRLAADRSPRPRCRCDGRIGRSVLPFPDATFDAALSSWTLCTIPDVHAALAELRRVLRPGGTLHFIEHGLARTRACAGGSVASIRSSSGSSAAAT